MNLDTLPSPNEQLTILKQQLDNFEFPNDPWSRMMNSTSIKPTIINFIYERPVSGKILKSVNLKPADFGIEEILSKLAESLIGMWNDHRTSDSNVMNVLAPSAIEDGTYLGYTFFADKLCLSGEVSLYINKK